jgi:predicted MPP superfamily phosphohydrolase
MLKVFLAVVAFGALCVLYAVFVERNWFALRTHRVACLPHGARPIRILHVSDLHLRAGQRRKRAFLRALGAQRADLVVGTGDFLGDAASAPATVETLGPMRSGAPALYVLGSNDYYGPKLKNPLNYFRKRRAHVAGAPNPWEEMVAGLGAHGWTLLSNETAVVDGVDVVGLDDAHIGRADLSVAAPRSGPGFRLAIAHSPDVANQLAASGYDLVLCGHTHGGQLCLPGFGALVTNSALPRRMAKGVHRIEGAWLHVCGGLGTSMFAPFRFACRPEACVLELTAQPG